MRTTTQTAEAGIGTNLQDLSSYKVLDDLGQQLNDFGVAQRSQGHRCPCKQKVASQDGDLIAKYAVERLQTSPHLCIVSSMHPKWTPLWR